MRDPLIDEFYRSDENELPTTFHGHTVLKVGVIFGTPQYNLQSTGICSIELWENIEDREGYVLAWLTQENIEGELNLFLPKLTTDPVIVKRHWGDWHFFILHDFHFNKPIGRRLKPKNATLQPGAYPVKDHVSAYQIVFTRLFEMW